MISLLILFGLTAVVGCTPLPTRLWIDRQPVPLRRGARVHVIASSEALLTAAGAALRAGGLLVQASSVTDPLLAGRLGRAFRHAALVHDGGTFDKIDEDFAPTRKELEALVKALTGGGGAPEALLVAWQEPPRVDGPGGAGRTGEGDLLAGLVQLERWRLVMLTARPDTDARLLLHPLVAALRRGGPPVRRLRPPLEADKLALPVPLLPLR